MRAFPLVCACFRVVRNLRGAELAGKIGGAMSGAFFFFSVFAAFSFRALHAYRHT